jgi:hypothetical protein
MLKQKMTILLIGLMCLSSASGLFRVICHGSDGHIAIEPAGHEHCECPETAPINNHDTLAKTLIGAHAKHAHCRDVLATLDVVLPAQKNITLSIDTIFTTNPSQNPTLNRTTCHFTHPAIAWLCKLSVFYEPLRTIVLLT